jgi:hypothetical protein
VGIIPADGPTLPAGISWALEQGGSGFAPPYVYPKGRIAAFDQDVQVPMCQGAKVIPAQKTLANHFLQNMTQRYPEPGTVFCYRELEQGLSQMVQEHFAATGTLPSDAAMQARAREIVQLDKTAADDLELLEKFKQMMREKVGLASTQAEDQPSDMANVEMNLSDEEVENMLQDIRFEVDGGTWYQIEQREGLQDAGGVALSTE